MIIAILLMCCVAGYFISRIFLAIWSESVLSFQARQQSRLYQAKAVKRPRR